MQFAQSVNKQIFLDVKAGLAPEVLAEKYHMSTTKINKLAETYKRLNDPLYRSIVFITNNYAEFEKSQPGHYYNALNRIGITNHDDLKRLLDGGPLRSVPDKTKRMLYILQSAEDITAMLENTDPTYKSDVLHFAGLTIDQLFDHVSGSTVLSSDAIMRLHIAMKCVRLSWDNRLEHVLDHYFLCTRGDKFAKLIEIARAYPALTAPELARMIIHDMYPN